MSNFNPIILLIIFNYTTHSFHNTVEHYRLLKHYFYQYRGA